MNHTLYQDGEINFTLQAPDNQTIAIFTVKEAKEIGEGLYRVSHTNLQKQGSPSQSPIATINGRNQAIHLAYVHAKRTAKELDPNFEDRTEIGRLEQTAQTTPHVFEKPITRPGCGRRL